MDNKDEYKNDNHWLKQTSVPPAHRKIFPAGRLLILLSVFIIMFSGLALAAGSTLPVYRKQKVYMENIFNFRTLGGYKSKYGGKVKKNKLYRSGELTFATDADLKKISRLGIRTVVDLRQTPDYLYCADRVPQGVKLVSRPAYRGGSASRAKARYKERKAYGSRASWRTAAGCRAYNSDWIYRQFMSKSYGKTLKKFLTYGKNGAILFHCMAGKDRTGNMAAITLMALGVSDDVIVADYALTNDAIASYGLNNRGVDALQMRRALRKIRKKYGSYERYLRKVQGITATDLKNLRKMFLVK